MIFISGTGFVVINFAFVETARVSALRLVLRRTHSLEVVPFDRYGRFGHMVNRLFFRSDGGISTLFARFQLLLAVVA